jgi:hypothetical protein
MAPYLERKKIPNFVRKLFQLVHGYGKRVKALEPGYILWNPQQLVVVEP